MSPCPFPTTITITPRPPTKLKINFITKNLWDNLEMYRSHPEISELNIKQIKIGSIPGFIPHLRGLFDRMISQKEEKNTKGSVIG